MSDAAETLSRHYPDMGEVIRRLGSVQIRNLGTIGGNIANGSPIGDSPPLLIVAGAKVFGKAIALYRFPQDISFFIGQMIDTPLAFIVVVAAVLLVMGLVFEALSMVLIMTPVLLPAAMALNLAPIWFGIFTVSMVECALSTPPVGLNLYVIQSVARTNLVDVSRGVLPFLLLMFLCVALLYAWTDLALYIPFKL